MRRILAVVCCFLLVVPGNVAAKGHPRHTPVVYHPFYHYLPTSWITGYDDRGYTATGTWAGWGTCAVDPGVIPLWSWVYVPGYGVCRALDTGGAVHGYHLDLWFSTAAQCYAATGWRRGIYWWR